MRRGVAEAVNHARGRSAFGAALVDQPLMVNVLADLAIESEAATATALRLARAYDEEDNRAAALRHRGPEVLDLQARDAARGRGARVPRRQRLRRGEPDAAAAARRAAERHLGGLGQRHEPRRAARDGPRARGPARLPGRVRARPRRRRAARRPPRLAPRDARRARRRRRPVARPARGRGPRGRLPGLAARPQRARRRGRRVLRRPARRVARPRLRDAAARHRRRGDRASAR